VQLRRTSVYATLLATLLSGYPASSQTLPASAPQSPASLPAIVQFTSQEPRLSRDGSIKGGLLVRELQRQALSLAVREELGLRTRDVALGETFSKSNPTILIGTQLQQGSSSDMILALPQDGTPKNAAALDLKKYIVQFPDKLLHFSHIVLDADPWLDYAQIAGKTEAFSRHDFPDALNKANIPGIQSGAPTVWSATRSTLPNYVAAELTTMDPVAQFIAVRALHQKIRNGGENPEIMDALVCGYANLALLTRFNFSGASKTYMARSLLYAERLIAHTGSSPLALYARAYARGLAGFSRLALDDINAAKKKQEGESTKTVVPDWLAVMDAWCHYNLADMQALAEATGPSQNLARTLTLAIALDGYADGKVDQVGMECLNAQPNNLWAMQALYSTRSLQMTGRMPSAILGAIPTILRTDAALLQLPDTATKSLQQFTADRSPQYEQVVGFADTLAANSQDDTGEPSLSALAAMIRDEEFTAVYFEANFLKNNLGAGVEEVARFVDSCRPAWQNHSLAGYMQSIAMDATTDHKAFRAIFDKVHPVDAGPWFIDDVVGPLSYADYAANWNECRVALSHADLLPMDFSQASIILPRPDRADFLDALRKESPDAATPMWAWMSTYPESERCENQAESEAAIADVKKRFAGRTLPLGQAAIWASDIHNRQEAIALLKELQSAEPSVDTAELLMQQYDLADDPEQAIAVAQQAEQLPMHGLEEAMLNNLVAKMLVHRHRYADAIPYATRAADSGASFGLTTLAGCEVGMGNMDKADAILHGAADRYPQDTLAWYATATRGSPQDLSQANDALGQYFVAHPDDFESQALADLLQGHTAESFELLQAHKREMSSLDQLFEYASIAAEAGDMEEAEAALKRTLAFKEESLDKEKATTLLAILDGADVRASLLALDLKVGPPARQTDIYENWMGRFLAANGHKAEAIIYLTRAIDKYGMGTVSQPLAAMKLKELGEDPDALAAAEKKRQVDLGGLIGSWTAQDPAQNAQWTFSPDHIVESSTGVHGLWWEDHGQILVNFTPSQWAVFPYSPGATVTHCAQAGAATLTLTKK
jgi:hypothetical protein